MILALPFVAVLAAVPASSVYFEQTTITSTDGKPGLPVLSRVWYSPRRMRLEAGEAPGGSAFLLLLDAGKAYRLDPEQKLAVAIDAARLRARSQMDLSLAGDLMGGAEEGTVRTSALRAGKTIAGYTCRGYRIRGPSVVMDVYLTAGIPLGVEAFADFLEWTGASQALGGILSEMRQLSGFPLETRARVTVLGRVHETVSTITMVKLGPHPSGLLAVPAGYRVVAEEPEPTP